MAPVVPLPSGYATALPLSTYVTEIPDKIMSSCAAEMSPGEDGPADVVTTATEVPE